MNKVKVGVIGVGYLGQHHVRIFSEIPQVELLGVCDINLKRAKEIASIYNIPFVTDDYRDLIDKVEAVSIVTPTISHFQIAKDFLEKGIHTFIEKPVTYNLREAEILLDIASGKDLVLQVGHIERFNPAVQELKKYIKNPFYIEARRMGPFDGRSTDVGVVMDLMIHDLDILFYILGKNRKIIDINGVGYSIYTPHEDFATVNILFEGDIFVNLIASKVSPKKLRKLDIHEKSGDQIIVDYIEQSISIVHGGAQHIESSLESPVLEREEPLRLELEHFVKCILEGKDPEVTLEDGKLALALATEILKELKVFDFKR
ncbi:Gfo/Idh/MocA family protein [Dictyoglomus thermophilum]|uniref:Oxidoreductase, Gfo/Idh/MocA family n=2 Tax=Dictyoglomus thermophilum TaxID=14 RepID=B5YDD3_DICT6|nr:Gfo/Idh/MocA family oxidoreductase [Dictyoglomus thermophilum]ACI19588.1 oxidoreductase, Gfo/Idh/MocA family [Dictyoglomus thermophilum H-6-12]MCX7721331.1 Gfo/Idh/MocA family oxidoreductase [Dictyoglomus thermophilum]